VMSHKRSTKEVAGGAPSNECGVQWNVIEKAVKELFFPL
jgi:hypothetical protein